MKINLRPLQMDDLALLTRWLNAPHMYPFYMQQQLDIDEVRQKFEPRIAGNHVVSVLIASQESRPYGYVQYYLNSAYPNEVPAKLGFIDGISIDYFIGEVHSIGCGLGSAMLRALVSLVGPQLKQSDNIFFVYHDKLNAQAIACSRRAGFTPVQEFNWKGKSCSLFQNRYLAQMHHASIAAKNPLPDGKRAG